MRLCIADKLTSSAAHPIPRRFAEAVCETMSKYWYLRVNRAVQDWRTLRLALPSLAVQQLLSPGSSRPVLRLQARSALWGQPREASLVAFSDPRLDWPPEAWGWQLPSHLLLQVRQLEAGRDQPLRFSVLGPRRHGLYPQRLEAGW